MNSKLTEVLFPLRIHYLRTLVSHLYVILAIIYDTSLLYFVLNLASTLNYHGNPYVLMNEWQVWPCQAAC